jgi:hypothetical protein
LNVPYLNISFKDEVSTLAINGTLSPLTVTYYLYDSSVYKTYMLTNNTLVNPSYQFCFTPNTTTVKVDITGVSAMTDYPVRNWVNSYNLTNATTYKVVELLSSSDGIYQTVIVITGIGDVVNGQHKGVLVNYHFSLNELIQGIPTIPNQ